jgi:hypothetical protein
MQGADRGWYFERPVGHDARFFPVLVPVFSTKHVIAEDRSEGKFSEVDSGQARLLNTLNGKSCFG